MQGLVTFGDLELADKKESFFQGLGMHFHSGTPGGPENQTEALLMHSGNQPSLQ